MVRGIPRVQDTPVARRGSDQSPEGVAEIIWRTSGLTRAESGEHCVRLECVQLKHVRQVRGECVLASVCMIYDLNYTRQSYLFEVKYGKTWTDAIMKPHTEWQANTFLEAMTGVEPRYNFASLVWRTPGHIARPPLGGRGILTIDTKGKDRHAVAWCNGLIYDSNAGGPLDWDLWTSCYPGAWLDGYHPKRER